MVPWPIAWLSLLYGVLAAASAATVWKIAVGTIERALIWPVVWLGLSVFTMCGLALLKPWARGLAILGLALIMVVLLAMAGLFAVSAHPWGALFTALLAGVPVIMIRYLRRPVVKAYFTAGAR